MSMCDLLIDYLIYPRKASLYLTDKAMLSRSMLVMMISLMSMIVSPYVVSGIALSSSGLGLRIAGLWLIGLMFWLCASALIHLLAEFSGGRGRVSELVTLVGFSSSPFFLLIPASLVVTFIGIAPRLLFILCWFLCLVWALMILSAAISETYSTGIVHAFILSTAPLYIIPFFIMCLTAGFIIMITILISAGSMHLIQMVM